VLRDQFGVSEHLVFRWVKAYRQQSTEGLAAKLRTGAKPKMPKTIKRRIIGMKKKHPEYDPRRIADVLKRFFLIPTSATSVHKALSDEGLTKKAKPKRVKNPVKPRFFERSRPNRFIQSVLLQCSSRCIAPDRSTTVDYPIGLTGYREFRLFIRNLGKGG